LNVESCTRKFEILELEELAGVHAPEDDYHLSPLIAPDEILRQFPPTCIAVSPFKIGKNVKFRPERSEVTNVFA
jgi:hypothetical protein